MSGTFMYQSCSGPMDEDGTGGTFGGELEFLPGSLDRPEGSLFPVRVMPFRLSVPDFIF